jgi:hypothetical protein
VRLNLLACPILLWFLIPCLCLGQQLSKRITNQEVIEMVSLGLSDDVIIDKIHTTAEANFDTSLAGLKALKAAKVSDAVIRAMINSHPGSAALANTTATTTAAEKDGLVEEVGVYIMLKGKPKQLEPEMVGWQTGGFIKSHASLGLVKGDLNGRVMKAKSPLQVPVPLEFLIKTPEGTSVAEYQLLRLHKKGNRREFRAVTGGVIHVSGGASDKNYVSVEPEKISNRTWRISLKDLQNGEYGFLPPGVSSSSISASGKIYTFGVIEGGRAPALWTSSSVQGAHVQEPTATRVDPAPEVVGEGSIGVSSDENPKVRHDGVLISHIVLGGPANQAGIQAGDVILAIDDHYIFTAEELTQEIRGRKPGTKAAIRYRRHSTIYDTFLIVGHANPN